MKDTQLTWAHHSSQILWNRKDVKELLWQDWAVLLLLWKLATPLGHSPAPEDIHAHELGSRPHKRYTDAHTGSWVSDWENKASWSWPFAPWAGKGSREAGGRRASGPGEKKTWSSFSPSQKDMHAPPGWGWTPSCPVRLLRAPACPHLNTALLVTSGMCMCVCVPFFSKFLKGC